MLARCPSCNKDVLFVSEKQYDGFSVVGEILRCTECGGEQQASETAATKKADPLADLFSDADLEKNPQVFDGNENATMCRYCMHYVVNPFRQRCMVHEKDVDATDTCGDFEAADQDELS